MHREQGLTQAQLGELAGFADPLPATRAFLAALREADDPTHPDLTHHPDSPTYGGLFVPN